MHTRRFFFGMVLTLAGACGDSSRMTDHATAPAADQLPRYGAPSHPTAADGGKAQWQSLVTRTIQPGAEHSDIGDSRDEEEGSGMRTADRILRAADQGDASAQNELGSMHLRGSGVLKDKTKALYWFQKAAYQGHAEAQLNLGKMYAQGINVPQDISMALVWLNKSAMQGNQEAMYYLARIHSQTHEGQSLRSR